MATATPAAAAFTISPYNQSTDNPTLASQCGLDFGLVLDSSGSIGNTGIANLKTAANAFVDSLVDTGSKVAVTSFSTTSPGTGGTNLAPTALTSANLTTVKNSYNNLSSNGFTNWQDGLTKMDAFGGWTSGAPDLMVFITDGNPNTIGNGPGNNASPDGSTTAVNPAITIANGMKTDGTKMFGIAVGSNITLNPIMAITNQTAYNGSNFPTAGYVQTNDYAALAQQLKELAVDLCAPSLTITKLADTPDTQGFQPANGWTFDTTVTIPGTTGKWVTPTTDAIPQNTASTRSAATANGGAVNFQWEPNGNFPTNPVIVKETLQNGYERDPLLVCVARNVIAGTQRNINPTVDVNGNWTLGSIESREIVTCTAKNTLTKLKLTKTVSGGGTVPADWTMTATSPNAPSYSKPGNHPTFEPINGGVVYTLGETPPAGQTGNYTPGTWQCTNGVNVSNGNQITVPKGTQTECTITNTRKTVNIKLVKKVDGGGSVPADWTLKADGPAGSLSYSKPGNHNAFEPIWANAEYTLSETAPAGQAANYTASTWTCDNGVTVNASKITVPAGTPNVTCEITNTRKTVNVKLVKKVDGGGSVAADWTLTATGPAGSPSYSKPGNHNAFEPIWANAEYTLGETAPAGQAGNYTASTWTCDKGVTVTGGKITVPAGTTDVTCEITNTRKTVNVKLVKKVDGGGSVAADWTLTATGPAGSPSYSKPGNHNAFEPIWANAEYTLGETAPAGQAGNYTPGTWSCDKGVTVTGGKITVPAGTTDVTCEITNTRNTAKLKLVKKVDGGTAVPNDWTLTATGPNGAPNVSNLGGQGTLTTVWSGVEYTLAENPNPGANYTASAWTCDSGVTVTGGKITLTKGAEVTCEITNTRNLAELKLVKKVTGDNGDKAPGAWDLTAAAAAPNNGKNFTVKGDADTFQGVFAGTEYTLSENGPFNYTPSDWVCKDAQGAPVSSTGGKVTVATGAKVTCEITNDRDTAELKLVKKVTGDNDAKGPNDWTLSADATAPLNDKNFSNLGGQGTFKSVYSAIDYTLSESGPGNYTASTWVCTDEQGAPVSSTGGKVNLDKGDKVTCEITNDRDTAELKLVKKVTGGDQAADAWTLSAAATAPLNDKNFSNLGGQGTFKSVYTAIEYTLGETGPGDYSPSDWVCTDEQGAPVSSTGGKLTLDKGDKVTCEITNDRDLGELKLVKKVTGDNGDKAPADWDLSAAAAAPLNGYNFTVAGDADTFKTVFSNTEYTLSESGPGNYTASTWTCKNGLGDPVSVTDGKVKVGKSAKVTCEITNDRNTAELKLVKKVSGGSATADDWTLTAKAAAPLNDKNISTPGGSGVFETVYSGTDYTLAESGPGNYTADAWLCESDQNGQVGPQMVQQGDIVSLTKGEKVTCTILNTRDLAQLKLVKQVEGKNNPDDWTLTAKAAAPDDGLDISTPGGSGQFEDVYAGSEYTLAETGPGGYTPSEWVCLPAGDVPDQVTAADLQEALNNGDTITLEKGQKVTCTIINTRDLGSLKITKVFDPKASGYATAFNIDYKCGDDPKQTVQVKAGESVTIDGIPTGTECTVTEVKPTDPPAGWSFSEPTYDPANGKVTVSEKGGTVAVTVTNEILKPGINIVKTASATQVNPGETVTYTYTVTNPGDATLDQVKVSDDKCAPVTYQSGDTNGDNKLQTTETWTFTCSMPITVATTNVAIASGKDKNGLEVTAQDSFTVAVVSPVVAKKICPIDVTLHKPQPKKVGNKVFTNKIKTKKSSCVLLKPVVLCRPLGSTAAGETAFCDTKVTKKGRITVKTKGYDAVKVSVVVRTKPKPGFTDQWKPNTWRKSWILR
ncbi:MAG: VWA domain-containing protein [Micrococcales bacterium]|nr:VWA domain-containing protein [Micrococcales bacterium]